MNSHAHNVILFQSIYMDSPTGFNWTRHTSGVVTTSSTVPSDLRECIVFVK